MGQPLTVTVTLTEIDCGQCGGTYAINERYRQQKYERKGYWHCPYCQTDWGYEKGQLELTQERLKAALARENEERAAKDKALRKLKRVGQGVCPECNRTFLNLAAHMTCKHGTKTERGM